MAGKRRTSAVGRQDGNYTAPVAAEPDGGPVPAYNPIPVPVIKRSAAEWDDWYDLYDDEPDEDTWALLAAMELFTATSEGRAWDPAKHPRIPKGQPGAGRFLSMVSRLTTAMEDHFKSGGNGDPFAGFNREQLRRAAKKRGLPLKRGMPRDDIAKLLLKDLADKWYEDKITALGKAESEQTVADVFHQLLTPAKATPKPQAAVDVPGPPSKKGVTPAKATPKPQPKKSDRESIKDIPQSTKAKIFADYKAQPSGQLLSSPAYQSWENLVAVAHVHGNQVPEGLSPGQVAAIVDEQLASHQNLNNQHLLETKIKDWLASQAGADYIVDHPNVNKSIVANLTGEVEPPPGVVLKPGQKVQTLSGPGGLVKSKDFPALTAEQHQAFQDAHAAAVGESLTTDQRAALVNYTGGGYSGMNDYLRTDYGASPLIREQVLNMQSAMVPLRHNALLHRGTGWNQLPEGFRDPNSAQGLVGKTLEEPGFMSTAAAGSGGAFSGPVRLEIEAPEGTMGRFVKDLSLHPHENEYVLSAGNKFKVIDVVPGSSGYGSPTVIRVRVVTPK